MHACAGLFVIGPSPDILSSLSVFMKTKKISVPTIIFPLIPLFLYKFWVSYTDVV